MNGTQVRYDPISPRQQIRKASNFFAASDSVMHGYGDGRRCANCGGPMSRYTPGTECNACADGDAETRRRRARMNPGTKPAAVAEPTPEESLKIQRLRMVYDVLEAIFDYGGEGLETGQVASLLKVTRNTIWGRLDKLQTQKLIKRRHITREGSGGVMLMGKVAVWSLTKQGKIIAALYTCGPMNRQEINGFIPSSNLNDISRRLKDLRDAGIVDNEKREPGTPHPNWFLTGIGER